MKILIIDSLALIHRVYHALPDLRNMDNEPVGALYGFCSMFLKAVKDINPDSIIAVFDSPVMTFRQKLYSPYHANRPKATPDFSSQIEKVKDFLNLIKIPIIEAGGFEGDDLIGSLITKLDDQNEIIVLTGDNDLLQLVKENVKVYTMIKGITQTIIYDKEKAQEKYGFDPKYLPDFKALIGDTSDNIPKVKGLGEKNAQKLIINYQTIENVFKNLDKLELNDKLKLSLKESKDQVFLAKDLATIKSDLQIEIKPEKFDKEILYSNEVLNFFKEANFFSLIKRLKPEEQNNLSFGFKKQDFKITPLTSDSWSDLKTKINKDKKIYFLGLEKNYLINNFQIYILESNNDQELKELLAIFKNREISKIGFNFKKFIKNFYSIFRNQTFQNISDLSILEWLLHPNFRNFSLEDLMKKYFKLDLFKITEKELVLRSAPYLETLANKILDKASSENIFQFYENLEEPLIPVLASMEQNGILIDLDFFKKAQKFLSNKSLEIQKEIFIKAGIEFNLNSPKQLSEILFDKLKLSTSKIRKLKSGYFSTDFKALEKLKDFEIVDLILKWRELEKLNSTYLNGLEKYLDKDNLIHTTFIQTGTITGRLASEFPNLQNIPKRGELSKLIRDIFISHNGFSLVSFDYSQIELRLLAHLSKDEKMVKAFLNNEDIHKLTASLIWKIPQEKVTPEQRSQAKTLNFGIIYGMGKRSLAQSAKISEKEALEFIKNYFDTFKGVSFYLEEVKRTLKDMGYLQTALGRKRYFADFIQEGRGDRIERMAVNFTIQGLAADLIKKAMTSIYQKFIINDPDNLKLLIQVHDELIFEINDKLLDNINDKIKKEMEEVYNFDVPLKVNITKGKRWSDL